jgi:hypothetical protein
MPLKLGNQRFSHNRRDQSPLALRAMRISLRRLGESRSHEVTHEKLTVFFVAWCFRGFVASLSHSCARTQYGDRSRSFQRIHCSLNEEVEDK